MKYAVVGLGAVGSIVAQHLITTMEPVVLLGKPNQMDIIKKQRLVIDGKTYKETNMMITDDFARLSDVDVVFICVKSQDTEPVAHLMQKHLNKKALIISLQNGVHNAQVLSDITKVKTISGVVLFNAVSPSPGVASLTIQGGLIIEFSNEYASVLTEVKRQLNTKELPVRFVIDIQPVLWSKLILNTQIAVTALTGQTVKESVKNRDSRRIIIATMREAADVVQDAGIKLSTLPGADPRRMIRILRIFGGFSAILSSVFLKVKPEARNSMWQSLARGKTTEIDYINGEIVRLAEQHYLKAPVNTILVDLVKKVEASAIGKHAEPKVLRTMLKL